MQTRPLAVEVPDGLADGHAVAIRKTCGVSVRIKYAQGSIVHYVLLEHPDEALVVRAVFPRMLRVS
jgi:hypothetical protein